MVLDCMLTIECLSYLNSIFFVAYRPSDHIWWHYATQWKFWIRPWIWVYTSLNKTNPRLKKSFFRRVHATLSIRSRDILVTWHITLRFTSWRTWFIIDAVHYTRSYFSAHEYGNVKKTLSRRYQLDAIWRATSSRRRLGHDTNMSSRAGDLSYTRSLPNTDPCHRKQEIDYVGPRGEAGASLEPDDCRGAFFPTKIQYSPDRWISRFPHPDKNILPNAGYKESSS